MVNFATGSPNCRIKDSTLSDVTFTLPDSIKVTDPNFTAVVSVYSMTYSNVFENIVENVNNYLEILSVYTFNGVHTVHPIEIVVPPGNYSMTNLLQYLNSKCGLLDSGFYYGFGDAGNPSYPGFVRSVDPAIIEFNPPTSGATGVLGTYDSAHVYQAFYIPLTPRTQGLLDTLGITGYVASIMDPDAAAGKTMGYGFNVTGTSGTTYYYPGNQWGNLATATNSAKADSYPTYTSPNCINLGGPIAITVGLESMSVSTRDMYNGLSIGDTVALIMCPAAYGSKICYQPPNPFKCTVPNLNLTQFRFSIRDAATGLPMDFRGANWMISMVFETFEIDNTYKTEAALEGQHRPIMPLYHHEAFDHNQNFSGMQMLKNDGQGKKRHRM